MLELLQNPLVKGIKELHGSPLVSIQSAIAAQACGRRCSDHGGETQAAERDREAEIDGDGNGLQAHVTCRASRSSNHVVSTFSILVSVVIIKAETHL